MVCPVTVVSSSIGAKYTSTSQGKDLMQSTFTIPTILL